ncbi:MAG: MarR family transcriptional regulator [Chloroflexi bacterium]|nr:MarR family transcriptional regulator [Chloroflexota bacterium]
MGSRSKQAARKFWETTPIIMKAMMSQSRQSEHNIAPVQFRILRMLATADCNLSELADRQGVSLPSISATAHTLVERGWLSRSRSLKDRRVVNLTVTDNGRRILKAEYERLLDWTADRLAPLSDEELQAVEEGMDALHRIFEVEQPEATSAL